MDGDPDADTKELLEQDDAEVTPVENEVFHTLSVEGESPDAGDGADHVERPSDSKLVVSPSTQSQLYKLYTSHFIATWSDRMWEFAVALFMMQIWPSSVSCFLVVVTNSRFFSQLCMGSCLPAPLCCLDLSLANMLIDTKGVNNFFFHSLG